MPFIDWGRLPAGVRRHLQERVRERSITAEDMAALAAWVKSNPEVPAGRWCKDFGSFILAGEGPLPKTFLTRGQVCVGENI